MLLSVESALDRSLTGSAAGVAEQNARQHPDGDVVARVDVSVVRTLGFSESELSGRSQ
jgi:hypothetical protein